MKLFAGLDGGQSSTVAVIGSEAHVLGRGTGPPADFASLGRDAGRQRAALEAALDAALDAARLPRETAFEAIVAGISGFEEGLSAVPDLATRTQRARVVHDTRIAHAGAFGEATGILVIAGTGSVALGNDAPSGAFVRAGGWGYFFGDEGSALWIARAAIRRAMAREDRAERTLLGDRARTFFGATALRQLQEAFACGDLERPALARFARETLLCAQLGDPDAQIVGAEAAHALADLCSTVDARLAPEAVRRVAYTGGVFSDVAFARSFVAAVGERLANAHVVPAADDPPTGAYRLARAGAC